MPNLTADITESEPFTLAAGESRTFTFSPDYSHSVIVTSHTSGGYVTAGYTAPGIRVPSRQWRKFDAPAGRTMTVTAGTACVVTVGSTVRGRASAVNSTIAALRSQVATLQGVADTATAQVLASQQDRALLHQQLQQLSTRLPSAAAGSANLGTSLLAAQSRDVQVTYTKPMPTGVAYSPAVSIIGGTGVLGALVLDGVLEATATGAKVRVRNTGLSSIAATAATVHVVAVA